MATFTLDNTGRSARGDLLHTVTRDDRALATDVEFYAGLREIESHITPADEYHEADRGRVYARLTYAQFVVYRQQMREHDGGGK